MLGKNLVLGIQLFSSDHHNKPFKSDHLHRIQAVGCPHLIIIDHHFRNSTIHSAAIGENVHGVMKKLHRHSDSKGIKGSELGNLLFSPIPEKDGIASKNIHKLRTPHQKYLSQPDTIGSILVDDLIPILKTPSAPLPWPWWSQCYNDRVYNCSPALPIIENDLKIFPIPSLISHHREFHLFLKRSTAHPIGTIIKILGGLPTDVANEIPYHHYLALEMLLGMGFTPTRATNVANRTVDVSMFILSIRESGNHLIPISRLGLHRLLAALMDLGNVRFTRNSPELHHLLTEARHQPFSLIQILKRIIDPRLRRKIAFECPQCSLLASSIHMVLAIEPPAPIIPLCLPNGAQSIIPMSSRLSVLSKYLNRQEQVMLARSFLYLVFDVPLFATICPKCVDLKAVPNADATILVNAMLECYCSPHSKFYLTD